MSIEAACPSCGKEVQLPEGAAGRKLRCGACGAISAVHEDAEGYRLERIEGGEARVEEVEEAPVREASRRHTVVRPMVDLGEPGLPEDRQGIPVTILAAVGVVALTALLELAYVIALVSADGKAASLGAEEEMAYSTIASFVAGLYILARIVIGFGLLMRNPIARLIGLGFAPLSLLMTLTLALTGYLTPSDASGASGDKAELLDGATLWGMLDAWAVIISALLLFGLLLLPRTTRWFDR